MTTLRTIEVVNIADFLNFTVSYLWNPPYDSWVTRLASTFFALSLFCVSPIVFLLALDFTSYAIVRTLGIENAHPVSKGSPQSTTATSIVVTEPQSPPPSRKPTMTITIPSNSTGLHPKQFDQTGHMDHIDHTDHFDHRVFATPGSANLELAGVGLFSPPESRTPSPPITRRSTRASLGNISSMTDSPISPMQPWQVPSTEDDEDGSVMLRRRKPVNSLVDS